MYIYSSIKKKISVENVSYIYIVFLLYLYIKEVYSAKNTLSLSVVVENSDSDTHLGENKNPKQIVRQ